MRSTTLLTRLGPAVLAAALLLGACGDDDDGGATVAFAEPADGATVHGGVRLVMAADGITIEEAGEASDGAGHFHVIADAGCLDAGAVIGKDADHVHFGAGQSEGVVYLAPGEHELCLQVGDGVHSALDVTDTISVMVAITSQDEWCEVMAELDEMASTVDQIDDYAVLQAGWADLLRLFGQLEDGSGFVDDTARADVRTALAFGTEIGQAFVTAADEDAAFEAVDEVYGAVSDQYGLELPGADWIQGTCDVDLED